MQCVCDFYHFINISLTMSSSKWLQLFHILLQNFVLYNFRLVKKLSLFLVVKQQSSLSSSMDDNAIADWSSVYGDKLD